MSLTKIPAVGDIFTTAANRHNAKVVEVVPFLSRGVEGFTPDSVVERFRVRYIHANDDTDTGDSRWTTVRLLVSQHGIGWDAI